MCMSGAEAAEWVVIIGPSDYFLIKTLVRTWDFIIGLHLRSSQAESGEIDSPIHVDVGHGAPKDDH